MSSPQGWHENSSPPKQCMACVYFVVLPASTHSFRPVIQWGSGSSHQVVLIPVPKEKKGKRRHISLKGQCGSGTAPPLSCCWQECSPVIKRKEIGTHGCLNSVKGLLSVQVPGSQGGALHQAPCSSESLLLSFPLRLPLLMRTCTLSVK